MTNDKVIEDSLHYLEGVYNRDRVPEDPSWEEIKPRVEKRLQYLFSPTEKVSGC